MGEWLQTKESRFRLYTRKKCFIVRAVWHWNRLPRKLWMFHPWKSLRLDGALSNLVYRKVSLLTAGVSN